jgi:hypothetical protein
MCAAGHARGRKRGTWSRETRKRVGRMVLHGMCASPSMHLHLPLNLQTLAPGRLRCCTTRPTLRRECSHHHSLTHSRRCHAPPLTVPSHPTRDVSLRSLRVQAVDRFVRVHDLVSHRVVWWLDGHTAAVTATAFAEHRKGCLVSVSEDRTYIVWDLVRGEAIFTSQIESPTPFVTVAVDSVLDRVAIGAVDGVVRFFSLRDFTLMHTLDLSVEMARHNRFKQVAPSRVPSGTVSGTRNATSSGGDGGEEAQRAAGGGGGSVVVKARHGRALPSAAAALVARAGAGGDLAPSGNDGGMLLQVAFVPCRNAEQKSVSGVAAVLEETEVRMVVVTTSSLVLVDTGGMHIVDAVPLGSQRDGQHADPRAPPPLRVAGAAVFGTSCSIGGGCGGDDDDDDDNCDCLRVLVCGAFERVIELNLIRVHRHDTDARSPHRAANKSPSAVGSPPSNSIGDGETCLSMLSDAPLLEDSPLHAVLTLAKKSDGAATHGKRGVSSARFVQFNATAACFACIRYESTLCWIHALALLSCAAACCSRAVTRTHRLQLHASRMYSSCAVCKLLTPPSLPPF